MCLLYAHSQVLKYTHPEQFFLFNVEVMYGITSGYVLCIHVCVCLLVCVHMHRKEMGGVRSY